MKKLFFTLIFIFHLMSSYSQTFTWNPSAFGCDRRWSTDACWAGNVAPSTTVRINNGVINFPASSGSITYDVIGPIFFFRQSVVKFQLGNNVTVNLLGNSTIPLGNNFYLGPASSQNPVLVNVTISTSGNSTFIVNDLYYNHTSSLLVESGVKLIVNNVTSNNPNAPSFDFTIKVLP